MNRREPASYVTRDVFVKLSRNDIADPRFSWHSERNRMAGHLIKRLQAHAMNLPAGTLSHDLREAVGRIDALEATLRQISDMRVSTDSMMNQQMLAAAIETATRVLEGKP